MAAPRRWRGGVDRPAEARLELHMRGRLFEDVSLQVLDLVEGLDDRDLGAAELVVFERIDEEAIEGRFQVGGQLERAFAPRRSRAAVATTRFDRSPMNWRSSAASLGVGGCSTNRANRGQLVVKR